MWSSKWISVWKSGAYHENLRSNECHLRYERRAVWIYETFSAQIFQIIAVKRMELSDRNLNFHFVGKNRHTFGSNKLFQNFLRHVRGMDSEKPHFHKMKTKWLFFIFFLDGVHLRMIVKSRLTDARPICVSSSTRSLMSRSLQVNIFFTLQLVKYPQLHPVTAGDDRQKFHDFWDFWHNSIQDFAGFLFNFCLNLSYVRALNFVRFWKELPSYLSSAELPLLIP